jgi:hypothetical protein
MPNKVDPRMYLILREDLAYKYIQGAHALAQFGLEHSLEFKEWDNKYLICLSVFNGLALRDVALNLCVDNAAQPYLEDKPKWVMSSFFEPDLESALPTAIAIFENGDGYVSRELKHLKMATK